MHLFADSDSLAKDIADHEPEQASNSEVQQLRAEIEELKQQINAIKAHLGL